MSIVSTAIVSDVTKGSQRQVLYRCTDSDNATHEYGPVISTDQNWDAEAHKAIVAAKVAAALAEAEFQQAVQ